MSMLVSQPRISTDTDGAAVEVNVGDGVSEGGMLVWVDVGEGTSVFVDVIGTISVTPGVRG